MKKFVVSQPLAKEVSEESVEYVRVKLPDGQTFDLSVHELADGFGLHITGSRLLKIFPLSTNVVVIGSSPIGRLRG